MDSREKKQSPTVPLFQAEINKYSTDRNEVAQKSSRGQTELFRPGWGCVVASLQDGFEFAIRGNHGLGALLPRRRDDDTPRALETPDVGKGTQACHFKAITF